MIQDYGMFNLLSEDSPATIELERKLIDFYSHSDGYMVAPEASEHPLFWQSVKAAVARTIEEKGRCRLLEFGAGKTGLGEYLQEFRPSTEFWVQDVSSRHAQYLLERADQVVLKPIDSFSEQFDVICSAFVWEHVINPRKTLDHLLQSLHPGGSLFLISPRYDFPGYISPSARSRTRIERFLISVWLQFRRMATILGGPPAFLIDADPAVLHGPFFRDSDAVHWVSLWDLQRHLPEDFIMRRVPLNYRGWHGILWERFCLLCVEIERREV